MKTKLKRLVVYSLFFVYAGVCAQVGENFCKTNLSKKDELLFTRAMAKKEKKSNLEKTGLSKNSKKKYTIPVIFHFMNTGAVPGGNGELELNGWYTKEDIRCQINSTLEISSGIFNNSIKNIYPQDYTVAVDERFADIKGKMEIEFIPATLDPYGNVLEIPGANINIDSGILDGVSSRMPFDPWWGKNDKYYLEVYVTETIADDLAAGFGVFPFLNVTPHLGVVISYVGGYNYAGNSPIGCDESYDFFGSETLIHEFGHYFGLLHTFEGGCGTINDQVEDTPPTTEGFGCRPNELNDCGVYPNYENFMSYNDDGCILMFTNGQVESMEFWLEEEISEINQFPRRNLWQPKNLIATGVRPGDIIANFRGDVTACPGEVITFRDNSIGTPTSWKWEFEGGTPAVSTDRNPTVVYENPGVYSVKLTAADEVRKRSHTVQKTNYISINKGIVKYLKEETFEDQFPPIGWTITNPDNLYQWHRRVGEGKGDEFCMAMNNQHNTRVGEKDYMQTPNYDFSNAFRAQMHFDLAYTKFDDASPDILKIQVSKDCGATWDEVFSKTHTELETAQIEERLSKNWTPNENHHWRKEIIDLSAYDGDSNVAIRFENISGFGTKIMIDNFKIKLRGNDRPTANISYKQLETSFCNDTTIITEFRDESIGLDTSTFWYFEGGTPSRSSEKNVTVIYDTPGEYDVHLISKNFYGEDQKILKDVIKIATSIEAGYIETFVGDFPSIGWVIESPDDSLTWEKRNDVGNGDTNCMIMNNGSNPTVGTIDEITLPSIHLSTGITNMSFDLAYTKYDYNSEDILEILGSVDCGSTWDVLYEKNHIELETVKVPTNESDDWIPTEAAHWRLENISLDRYKDSSSDFLIKFKNTSGFGTRIWIDNIKFYSKSIGLKNNDIPKISMAYPNPTQGVFTIDLGVFKDQKPGVSIQLYDITGKLIEEKYFENKAPASVSLGSKLKEPGTYFVKILNSSATNVIKVIKQ